LNFLSASFKYVALIFVTGLLHAGPVQAESPAIIRNPFYSTPQWKLWHADPRPVQTSEKLLQPVDPDERIYPVNAPPDASAGQFLVFREGNWPDRKFAGIWDDVYASLDRHHSYLPVSWTDENNNVALLREQSMDFTYADSDKGLRRFGVNFTSQSTVGVGHDLIDSTDKIMILEREFCFANILRSGPAHISYREKELDRIDDKYDAIVPCYFNSVGSSGSEVNALAKMMIAGGYLPVSTKYRLKDNGLYIPTLLYIWKAGLPYDVPYASELRHRVAYASSGRSSDKRLPIQAEINRTYHRYDETQHLKNMIHLAESMETPPPIALIQNIKVAGGSIESSNKTAIRVYQKKGESVRIHVSARQSFDLADRPISYHWQALYQNTEVRIEPLLNGRDAIITVPFDARLPKGRTVVMLTVNNGIFDSNPAMINIYRPYGKDNLRPSLSGLSDTTVLSGETVRFEITSEDPEGFPTTLYRWSNEIGELNGNSFSWKTTSSVKPVTRSVSIITTDGTAGYNSKQVTINVTPVIAKVSANKSEGDTPFQVAFSSDGSRDMQGGELQYSWDFGDGNASADPNPGHTFETAGLYEVTLTVTSDLGVHSASQIIHVRHAWPRVLDNGWSNNGIDKEIWHLTGPVEVSTERQKSFNLSMALTPLKGTPRDQSGSLTSNRLFAAPLFLEATYKRINSRKNTGIAVLGNLIGKLGATRVQDTSIGHPIKDETWDYQPIAYQLKFPKTPTKLSLYVTPDPNHSGKIMYAGWLDTPQGRKYFRYDNQRALNKNIEIMTNSKSGRFEFSAFSVWAAE
jgi:PKD repeat protein